MSNRVLIVQGYAWHLIPVQSVAPALPYKEWQEAESGSDFALISYGKEGKLVLTKQPLPPPIVIGWLCQKVEKLDETWYVTSVGKWKWKLLHEYEDGLCVFAGVMI